jgi:hypothetical protein
MDPQAFGSANTRRLKRALYGSGPMETQAFGSADTRTLKRALYGSGPMETQAFGFRERAHAEACALRQAPPPTRRAR